jgi:hypothetical protein
VTEIMRIALGGFVLGENVCYEIQVARQHYSAERLAERAKNRKLYFDTKYPDRKLVTLHG